MLLGEKTTGEKVEAFILAARKAMKPSEVFRLHTPGFCQPWLREQILRKLGPHPGGLTDSMDLVLWAIERGQHPDHLVFDHYGCTNYVGDLGKFKAFVSEPYGPAVNGKMLAAYQRFANMLDLNLRLDGNSWHFPGHTVRFVFWPKGSKR